MDRGSPAEALTAVFAFAIAFALALNSTAPLAVTHACFHDSEKMAGNAFSAFGSGPKGLSLLPGESKPSYASELRPPGRPIARACDGSLDLDFGEVTFDNESASPDVFRIRNRTDDARIFRVVVSPTIQDLFRTVVIVGGASVAPGEAASVLMEIDGGARPPGSYSGTLVVSDRQDEFYRVVRVTLRILGTHETEAIADAVEVVPTADGPDGSVEPTQVAPDPGPAAVQGTEPAPDQGAQPRPAPVPEPAPADPVPDPAPEPAPKPKPEPEPEPQQPADPPTPPSGVASPSAGSS